MLHLNRVGQAPPPHRFGSDEAISLNHLAGIRAFIEGCTRIETISEEMRELVESRWPDLAGKLPRR